MKKSLYQIATCAIYLVLQSLRKYKRLSGNSGVVGSFLVGILQSHLQLLGESGPVSHVRLDVLDDPGHPLFLLVDHLLQLLLHHFGHRLVPDGEGVPVKAHLLPDVGQLREPRRHQLGYGSFPGTIHTRLRCVSDLTC